MADGNDAGIHLDQPEHGIVRITFDRPSSKNGIMPEGWDRLARVCDEIGRSPEARAVIVRGAGGNFSSGGQMRMRDPEAPPPPPLAMMHRVNEACRTLRNLPQPTIASVQGIAVGAGFNIALACDLVIAESSARFSQIFVRRGMTPDFGGSWLLTHAVGLHKAKELALLGRMLSAEEVAGLGLLNRVVPDGAAEELALEWAREIAQLPPVTVSQIKSMLNAAASSTFEEALGREASSQQVNMSTADTKEAITSFVEKRRPDFLGY